MQTMIKMFQNAMKTRKYLRLCRNSLSLSPKPPELSSSSNEIEGCFLSLKLRIAPALTNNVPKMINSDIILPPSSRSATPTFQPRLSIMASSSGGRGGKKRRAWRPPKAGSRDQESSSESPDLSYTGNIIEIDGSVKEGGGQILRNAAALSCLLGKAIHITKIRAGRGTPGLRPQHLTGLQLLANMCRGKLVGGHPGSTEITFIPGPITSGRYTADTKTAGSICLLLQVALPCLLFAKERSELLLRGGTDVDMAPPIDYTIKVFKPLLELMGVRFNCTINQRGFFPKGRGEVLIIPEPVSSLSPITLVDRGEISQAIVESFTAGSLLPKIGHEMATSAKSLLTEQLLPTVPVTVETRKLTEREPFGNGSCITSVICTTTGCLLGASYNGNKNESAERSGRRVAEELIQALANGSCVDDHMQDQLIIFMALAKGHSQIKTGPLTLHTETAIHIVELITDVRFNVLKTDDTSGTHIIECDGLGIEI